MQREREREKTAITVISLAGTSTSSMRFPSYKPPWGVPSHVSWDSHGNRSGTEPSFLRLTVFTGVHR